MKFLKSPTLRLLNSSTAVAISGALRLHIAFLFAGIEPMITVYFSFGLIVYAVYTFDRVLDCEEDIINRSELARSNKCIGFIACIITFLGGSSILFKEDLYFASLFPLIIGCMYSKGIKIGMIHLKLKGSMGGKNIIIALTWGGTIGIILSKWSDSNITTFLVFLFYAAKLFMNSIIYDFKDIEGDTAAGIKTLPVFFGRKKIKKMLTATGMLLHSYMITAILMDLIRSEPVILFYSLFVNICTSFYVSTFQLRERAVRKYAREFLIDAESAIALILRYLINSLFSGSAL